MRSTCSVLFAISLFVILLSPLRLLADAIPHFDNTEVVITIDYRTSKPVPRSKVILLLPTDAEGKMFDTIGASRAPHYGIQRYPFELRHVRKLGTTSEEWQIFAHAEDLPDFRLRIILDTTSPGSPVLESPVLHAAHKTSELRIVVTDSVISDDTTFFQMGWGIYFEFLFVTILIESLLALRYFKLDGVPYKKIDIIITANLISHPILWALCTYVVGFGFANVVGEIGVVFFEALWIHLFLREHYTYSKALKLSLVLNTVSYVVGAMLSVVG